MSNAWYTVVGQGKLGLSAFTFSAISYTENAGVTDSLFLQPNG